MDNILKLVLGCLGIVGFLVMMIPSGDPLAPPPAAPAVTNGPAPQGAPLPSANPAAPLPAEPPKVEGFAVEDHDIASFGKPMVDPTPPGQRKTESGESEPGESPNGGQSSYPNFGPGGPGVAPRPSYPVASYPTMQPGSSEEDE
jgi:hypothetical protein